MAETMVDFSKQGIETRVAVIAVPVDLAVLNGPVVDVELAVEPVGRAPSHGARLTIWGDYPPRPGVRLYEGPPVYSRIQGQDEAFLKYIATGEYGIWRWQPLQSTSVAAARRQDHDDSPRSDSRAAGTEWRAGDLSPSTGRQAGEYRIRLLVYAANGDLAAIF